MMRVDKGRDIQNSISDIEPGGVEDKTDPHHDHQEMGPPMCYRLEGGSSFSAGLLYNAGLMTATRSDGLRNTVSGDNLEIKKTLFGFFS